MSIRQYENARRLLRQFMDRLNGGKFLIAGSDWLYFKRLLEQLRELGVVQWYDSELVDGRVSWQVKVFNCEHPIRCASGGSLVAMLNFFVSKALFEARHEYNGEEA